MFIWEINALDENLVGSYEIYLQYEIQSEYQIVPFKDTEARFMLTLMYGKEIYDNQPPTYSKEFPSEIITLLLNETYSFDSEKASNDTIRSSFKVIGD